MDIVTDGLLLVDTPPKETYVYQIYNQRTWLYSPAEDNQLGEGSFGTVYSGKWLGTRVAIKKLPRKKRNRRAGTLAFDVNANMYCIVTEYTHAE